jgi:hypothetical protein
MRGKYHTLSRIPLPVSGTAPSPNDAKVPLTDEQAGGCSDGLTGAGRSRNQGAESTLAMIAMLRHGHRMATAPARSSVAPGDSPAGTGTGTTRD